MTRATDTIVDELHALTAYALIDQLKAYRAGRVLDPDGAVLPLPPALLAQASKFLKDNGIDSPTRASKLKDAYAGVLPDFDDVAAEHGAPN